METIPTMRQQKDWRRHTLLGTALGGPAIAIWLLAASAFACTGEESLDGLLNRYVQETGELVATSPTAAQKAAFHRTWLETMSLALAAHRGPSAERSGVIGVALSLANTLGELERAQALADDLYEAVRGSRGSRVWAARVQAETALARARKETDRAQFIRARDHLLHALEESTGQTWPELARTRHLDERLVCLDLLGQCLIELEDLAGAATAFGRGAVEGPEIRRLVGTEGRWSLGVEYFSQQAAFAAARAGDIQSVRAHLDRIAELPAPQLAPSAYVDRAGRLLADDEAYASLARSWLEAHPRDASTVVLEFGAARALSATGRSAAAMEILERLHAEHMDEVEAIDRAHATRPSGTEFAPSLLLELGRLLHLAGRTEDAASVHAELLRDYPASPHRYHVTPTTPGDGA
jgi:tetratricopeptide (TPR) repeat protein